MQIGDCARDDARRGEATRRDVVPGIIIIDHELRRLRELGGLSGLAVPICRNIHYRES